MSGIKDWLAGAANEATGLAKRAAGELTARPDLVLDGERQQARGRKEVAAAGDEKEEGGHRTTVGWKLDPAERTGLLALFPPHYAITVADHVTLAANAPAEMPLPPFRVGGSSALRTMDKACRHWLCRSTGRRRAPMAERSILPGPSRRAAARPKATTCWRASAGPR